MNKVTLRPVAIVDMNVKYARMMGENKIRHYSVSVMETIKHTSDPLQMVQDHIVAEEGPTEFEVIETPYTPAPTGIHIDPAPYVLEGTEIDLGEKRCEIIHQFNELVFQPKLHHRILGYFTRAINRFIIGPINALLYRHSMLSFNDGLDNSGWEEHAHTASHNFEVAQQKKSRFRAFVAKIPHIPFLNAYETNYVRSIAVVRFLSVGFEQGQEEMAAELIRSDLRKIPKDAIKGHLCEPSVMLLADTIGDGKLKGAMLTFIHVADRFLPKDVKFETEFREGEVSRALPPAVTYEIEEVNVANKQSDADHEAYLASLKPFYDKKGKSCAAKIAQIKTKPKTKANKKTRKSKSSKPSKS